VKKIAQQFITTAVARKNLDTAYDLVGPQIKQGMMRSEWNTGNIAVIPFPVDKLDFAPFKVDYAHPGDVLMEGRVARQERIGRQKPDLHQREEFGKGDKARWLVDNCCRM